MSVIDRIEEDLDTHLIGDLDQEVDTWDITVDDVQADRALRALGAIDRKLARYEAVANAERDRIAAWLEEVSNPLAGRRQFFERCLETYTRANHELSGDKSMKLPSGTVQLRQSPPRIDTAGEPGDDIDPRLVRVTRAWDKAAVKHATKAGGQVEDHDTPEGFTAYAAVTTEGEILPGVIYLVRDEPTFDAKPNPIGGVR
jgi:hypothetical protein